MPIQKTTWNALSDFIPEGTLPFVNRLLSDFTIKLVITRPRSTLLGYYKPPQGKQKDHIITINRNLNLYMFLIVLVHEIAHMKTHVKFGRKAKPHGIEWQNEFRLLLEEVYQLKCLPPSVQKVIHKRIVSPTVLHSCMDVELTRALKAWDKPNEGGLVMVEQIPIGGVFEDTQGRKMQLLKKQRSRFLCKQINTFLARNYLYPATMEVKPL